MPRAAVGVTGGQGLGDEPMQVAAFGGRRGRVHRRPDQGVRELDPAIVRAHQPEQFGALERSHVEPARGTHPDDHRKVAVGDRGDQQDHAVAGIECRGATTERLGDHARHRSGCPGRGT